MPRPISTPAGGAFNSFTWVGQAHPETWPCSTPKAECCSLVGWFRQTAFPIFATAISKAGNAACANWHSCILRMSFQATARYRMQERSRNGGRSGCTGQRGEGALRAEFESDGIGGKSDAAGLSQLGHVWQHASAECIAPLLTVG